MTGRRRPQFWIPLLFGLLGLSRTIGNPRLASVRGVDIVLLIATGMCLGAALAMIVASLRRSREVESGGAVRPPSR